MKKIIVFLFAISFIVLLTKDNSVYIDNGIRYRIIANSDSVEDQNLKWKINDELITIIKKMDSSSKESMDQSIKEYIPEIENAIKKYTDIYSVNYGNNFFPQKEYKGTTYAKGYYPSLVITLGESSGHNWWCFMFPPLCSLEYQKDNISNVEYDFYFKKIINKYL